MKSVKALVRAEKHYFSLGYDPVDAITLIYERALKFYDNVFPEDEVDFRKTLVTRYEKQLKWAYQQRRKEQNENEGASSARLAETES